MQNLNIISKKADKDGVRYYYKEKLKELVLPMNMTFNCWWWKCRKVADVEEYILMSDNCEARVVQVQPVRDLTICHQEDPPYPWCILLQGSQWIPQLLTTTKQRVMGGWAAGDIQEILLNALMCKIAYTLLSGIWLFGYLLCGYVLHVYYMHTYTPH